jgi:dTDP-4-amino-4,6-dideoxygalactose transaminase
MRPKLPSADEIAPYLKKIDATRTYSNFGPLVRTLEARLASHYGLEPTCVATVVNATIGLALALAVQGARPGALCLMPSWTFVASAHAAILAGLTPYFADVDPETWALDPKEMDRLISQAPGEIGAIMPVAPFGRSIDAVAWDHFRDRSGLPVVIDAAAGFDSVVPSRTPAVVSLHATKVLGIGEGGFLISADASLAKAVQVRANFGFVATREAATPAINAKLSEYHAAVGLAALDRWEETRQEWIAVAGEYRDFLPESNRLRFQEGFGQSWITSTCLVHFLSSNSAEAEAQLSEAGIETRRWWGQGAHAHPAMASFPRTALPATELLARSTLAVPFHPDLDRSDIQRISAIILDAERH